MKYQTNEPALCKPFPLPQKKLHKTFTKIQKTLNKATVEIDQYDILKNYIPEKLWGGGPQEYSSQAWHHWYD